VSGPLKATPPCDVPESAAERPNLKGLSSRLAPRIKPGACFPWEAKARELPEITGDAAMVKRVWEELDGLANTFIWQVLLSF
jgi:hypothetical protein